MEVSVSGNGCRPTIGAMIFLSGKSLTFLASDIGFAALPVALFAGLESIGGLILAGVILPRLEPLLGSKQLRRRRVGGVKEFHLTF